MGVREKVGVFGYHSGNSQGILIHVLGMNPVHMTVRHLQNIIALELWNYLVLIVV